MVTDASRASRMVIREDHDGTNKSYAFQMDERYHQHIDLWLHIREGLLG